ncbi:PREDICTED: plant UBX domain-containing protein 4-like [Camelina sativa]|uniref:Plant UBX domain-containing protein 4-like n=1 Tax=Camelina sativa TaxID=90675 RepID=A0ABM1RGN4_CAMSA|nr:PREDICTED: plant UBX domain-containing protein 4-like [Camelina sativa]
MVQCERVQGLEREKRKVSFQGVGKTLGGSNDGSESSSLMAPDSTSIPIQTIQSGSAAQAPSQSLEIDETVPTTSIQLRLADGTRLVAKFNHHHTINDIRSFIDSSRPGAPVTYQFQAMEFPPKPLTDLRQTIKQAGLANSVLLQKFENFLQGSVFFWVYICKFTSWLCIVYNINGVTCGIVFT